MKRYKTSDGQEFYDALSACEHNESISFINSPEVILWTTDPEGSLEPTWRGSQCYTENLMREYHSYKSFKWLIENDMEENA